MAFDAKYVAEMMGTATVTKDKQLSKNEYIALELTKYWALGLPNRSGLYMKDILKSYDKALEHLEGKKNETS